MACGGGGGDLGSCTVGQLDGEESDSAGASVDEDAVALLQLGAEMEALPCREHSDGGGGGSDIGKRSRFPRKRRRLGDAELGGRAVGEPVIEAVNGIAGGVAGDSCADGGDSAGEFVSGDGVGSRGTVGVVGGGVPELFGGSDAGGGDADEEFAGLRLGNGTGGEPQSECVGELHCFHGCHGFTPEIR